MDHQLIMAQRAANLLTEDPELTINAISKQLRITPRHLRRVFKAKLGQSPKDFRAIIRIKEAQRRIQEGTHQKLADVAYNCGFSDQTYFCREFKKHVGMTPSNFRSSLAS